MGDTGVTCYTCHRGKHIPEYVWTRDPGPPQAGGMARAGTGQNRAGYNVGLASLPSDPFTAFLENDTEVSVIGHTALPVGNTDRDVVDTEWTYALMIHFSNALGVNCTHCHNSRSFFAWDQSAPERVQAWHALVTFASSTTST